ncbi:hypothetical protein [Streptomyces sp. NBC_01012]|uniref:hypothetical protein n=1 Tax=Streptomyces sp. NBC_01012 TaxID=2903717 RepID=UPI003863349C|nr:hypothetical protein OG623_04000 [Streptomyces sp. NBC_01012]
MSSYSASQARDAVLHAVDDLLIEAGYATLTMKGIAMRAGVGRQTASAVLTRIDPARPADDQAIARLTGPVFFWIMSGCDPARLDTHELARSFLNGPGSEKP